MLTALMNTSEKSQRIVAFSVSTVLLIMVLVLGQILANWAYSNYAAVNEKRILLGQLNAVAAAGASFQTQLLPENGANPMLLSGENEAVMTAALQSWLQEVIGSAGGQINSVNNISEDGENDIRMLGLTVNFSGSMETIHRTLSSIERNRPRLFLKEIEIHSNHQQISPEEDLPVELTATVVFLGASTKPKNSP